MNRSRRTNKNNAPPFGVLKQGIMIAHGNQLSQQKYLVTIMPSFLLFNKMDNNDLTRPDYCFDLYRATVSLKSSHIPQRDVITLKAYEDYRLASDTLNVGLNHSISNINDSNMNDGHDDQHNFIPSSYHSTYSQHNAGTYHNTPTLSNSYHKSLLNTDFDLEYNMITGDNPEHTAHLPQINPEDDFHLHQKIDNSDFLDNEGFDDVLDEMFIDDSLAPPAQVTIYVPDSVSQEWEILLSSSSITSSGGSLTAPPSLDVRPYDFPENVIFPEIQNIQVLKLIVMLWKTLQVKSKSIESKIGELKQVMLSNKLLKAFKLSASTHENEKESMKITYKALLTSLSDFIHHPIEMGSQTIVGNSLHVNNQNQYIGGNPLMCMFQGKLSKLLEAFLVEDKQKKLAKTVGIRRINHGDRIARRKRQEIIQQVISENKNLQSVNGDEYISYAGILGKIIELGEKSEEDRSDCVCLSMNIASENNI